MRTSSAGSVTTLGARDISAGKLREPRSLGSVPHVDGSCRLLAGIHRSPGRQASSASLTPGPVLP